MKYVDVWSQNDDEVKIVFFCFEYFSKNSSHKKGSFGKQN